MVIIIGIMIIIIGILMIIIIANDDDPRHRYDDCHPHQTPFATFLLQLILWFEALLVACGTNIRLPSTLTTIMMMMITNFVMIMVMNDRCSPFYLRSFYQPVVGKQVCLIIIIIDPPFDKITLTCQFVSTIDIGVLQGLPQKAPKRSQQEKSVCVSVCIRVCVCECINDYE